MRCTSDYLRFNLVWTHKGVKIGIYLIQIMASSLALSLKRFSMYACKMLYSAFICHLWHL